MTNTLMPKVVKCPSDVLVPSAAMSVTEARVADAPVEKPKYPPPGFSEPVRPEEPAATERVRVVADTPKPESQCEKPRTATKQSWRFVKNRNPKETVRLSNGRTFVFPGTVFLTYDAELALELLAVADRYSIVEK